MYSIEARILLLILILMPCCGPHRTEKEKAVSNVTDNSEIKGTISISGAYALFPVTRKWADDFMKLYPEVRIEVYKTGTGQGIEDLISNKCHIALISRALTELEINSGVWVVPVAKDGVAPIVSQKNPYLGKILRQGLSTDEFIRAFTGESSVTWGELLDTAGVEPVVPLSREDESGAASIWADFLYKSSADLKGKKVTGDEEMIKSIADYPFSIGFCNFSYAFNIETGERLKDIQIVPFDLNFDNKILSKELPFNNLEKAHRGLWLGLYPKALCRELTLGTLGKPTDPLIVTFINYALTKGQDDIKTTGLCELNDVYLKYALDRLK